MGLARRLICRQLLIGHHTRIIRVLGNIEFKAIVLSYSCSILSCKSVLMNGKPRLCCRLDDNADFCSLLHVGFDIDEYKQYFFDIFCQKWLQASYINVLDVVL